MSVIDFEKDFDSLSLDFLFKYLGLFGFCVSFIFRGTQRRFPPKYVKTLLGYPEYFWISRNAF